VVLIRQILNYAVEEDMLAQLPRIPSVGTIDANPRPWLTKLEWAHLRRVSLNRIEHAPNVRVKRQRQDVHDLMIFLVDSMLRVGEVRTLKFASCRVETNADGDKMLLCEVTGKHGTRTVVALRGAAWVYERRMKQYDPTGLLFPEHSRDAFRELLIAAGLREDAFGFERNLKSLRATSISFRLLDNPEMNLQIVARNAGTSVQMIDTYYAKRLTAEMSKEALSKLPNDAFRRPSKAQADTTRKRLQGELQKSKADDR